MAGPAHFLEFCALFVPVWWLWITGTYYNEALETQDVSQRVIVFLQMLPVLGMADFVHDGLGDAAVPFGLSYIAGRLLSIGLYLRTGFHNPEQRSMSNVYSLGFGLAVVLIAASLPVLGLPRYILWACGLAVELITPWLVPLFVKDIGTMPETSSKLPERFGLFTIIVLGGSLEGVVHGLAESHQLSMPAIGGGALGLCLTFGIWWLYFDFVAERPRKTSRTWRFLWAMGIFLW